LYNVLVNHSQSQELNVLIGNTTNTQTDAHWDIVGVIMKMDNGNGTLLQLSPSRVLRYIVVSVNVTTFMAVCEEKVYKTGTYFMFII